MYHPHNHKPCRRYNALGSESNEVSLLTAIGISGIITIPGFPIAVTEPVD